MIYFFILILYNNIDNYCYQYCTEHIFEVHLNLTYAQTPYANSVILKADKQIPVSAIGTKLIYNVKTNKTSLIPFYTNINL